MHSVNPPSALRIDWRINWVEDMTMSSATQPSADRRCILHTHHDVQGANVRSRFLLGLDR
jgi:hypothetical protein